ncbi:MAG TPA: entericidin A/B family lipoprotein [Opitutaceae bacterium]
MNTSTSSFALTLSRQFAMVTIMASIAFVCLSILAACNTMEGVGEDVERAGEEIQDGARK